MILFGPDESVRLFVARLKVKAEHCDFKVKYGSADCGNHPGETSR